MNNNRILSISKVLEVFQHGFHRLLDLRLIFKNNILRYIRPSISESFFSLSSLETLTLDLESNQISYINDDVFKLFNSTNKMVISLDDN